MRGFGWWGEVIVIQIAVMMGSTVVAAHPFSGFGALGSLGVLGTSQRLSMAELDADIPVLIGADVMRQWNLGSFFFTCISLFLRIILSSPSRSSSFSCGSYANRFMK